MCSRSSNDYSRLAHKEVLNWLHVPFLGLKLMEGRGIWGRRSLGIGIRAIGGGLLKSDAAEG
eukprot:374877-Amphidinium_carterae.1